MRGRGRAADLLFGLWAVLVALDIALQESLGVAWYWTVAALGAWFTLGWTLGWAQVRTGRPWFWWALLAWGAYTLLGLAALLARYR